MKTQKKSGIVYSTDPDFKVEDDFAEEVVTLSPNQQKLIIRLETKHRAGKTVTLIDGFVGSLKDAEWLGKSLKNFCGAGGAAKDGEIIIQGDHREKVMQWLLKNGYVLSKKR